MIEESTSRMVKNKYIYKQKTAHFNGKGRSKSI